MRNIPNFQLDAENETVAIDLDPVPYLAGTVVLSADELVDRGKRNVRAHGEDHTGEVPRRPVVDIETDEGVKHFTWSEAIDWAFAEGNMKLAGGLLRKLADHTDDHTVNGSEYEIDATPEEVRDA